MVALAPYLVGWSTGFGGETPARAYLHRGRLYLDGLISNIEGAVGSTILSGLPPELCPGANVALTFPTEPRSTTDPLTPGLQLPRWWGATMKADGMLVLTTPIPPQVNTPPSEEEYYWYEENPSESGEFIRRPQYIEKLQLCITIGNASWDVLPEEDSPALSPLGHLTASYTDSGSLQLAHGNRVHLGGAVVAAKDTPGEITEVPAIDAADGGEAASTAVSGGKPVPLLVSARNLRVSEDQIKPAGQPPALSAGSPGSSPRHNYTSAAQGTAEVTLPFDFGTYNCTVAGTTIACAIADEPPGLALSLATLVGLCLPLPPWFFVKVSAELSGTTGKKAGTCEGFLEPKCGSDRPIAGITGTWAGASVVTPGLVPATFSEWAGRINSEGLLLPPEPLYSGETGLVSGAIPGNHTQLLWTPAQFAGVGPLSVSFSGGYLAKGAVDISATIHPFYDRREWGLHSGDTLDLTHTGWPCAPLGGLELGRYRRGVIR